MLGGLAFKRRWQEARRAAGKPTDRPNLVMSSAVQVVWEKFCNYWDVEPRYVPITEEHKTPDGTDLKSHVDENTISVGADGLPRAVLMPVLIPGQMVACRALLRRSARPGTR